MLSSPINLYNKKILLAPLDWGMGHAARCVPLIKQLQQQQNSLVIACTKQQQQFLEQEISGVEFASLFGYNMSYAKVLPLWVKILFQLPKLSAVVKQENKWLANYLKENKTDVVISDNRFGFYNENVESIFITHQLNVQAPFFQNMINRINGSFIKKYNICWVPDYVEEEKRLSGILSVEKNRMNAVFIGPLSRFQKTEWQQKKHDVLIVLSGPEPQRTLLEEKLVLAFANTSYKIALVRGSFNERAQKLPSNFYVINVASSKQLQELLSVSEKIICRSGYSTLMDLDTLNAKALLIPTPGQSEQEYLAKYWQDKFACTYLEQKNISEESIKKFMLA
ncbi:MAG TPA: glycosyltransferase [Bacteroidia bacterium]|nr:glycosyltransferase [Bacteroidia bacterium]